MCECPHAHAQIHTCTHIHTKRETTRLLLSSGRGPRPLPVAPPPNPHPHWGCLISSEINHEEGREPHKSLKQTSKSNSTIYPARASSSEQGVGGTRQQNQPCPARATFAPSPWGGNLGLLVSPASSAADPALPRLELYSARHPPRTRFR